jgi:DNA-binding LacI/PurR family transcriptional regulator
LAWLNHWRDPGEFHHFRTIDGYWRGAYAAAAQHGFRLEEFVANDPSSLKATAKVLRARNISGILIMPGQLQDIPDRAWDEFPWQDFSVVRFGRRITHPRFHIVTASQTFDCLMACEKMTERGYKRIGMATFEQTAGWNGYLGGYLMAQSNIKASQRLGFLIKERGLNQKAFERWLAEAKPDAILTDLIEVPAALKRAGYRVPKDIGLAVLNVSDIKADAGIYQFPEETGQVAIETLLSLIYHNHRGIPKVPREVLVCGQWQDGSTLPPRRPSQRRSP